MSGIQTCRTYRQTKNWEQGYTGGRKWKKRKTGAFRLFRQRKVAAADFIPKWYRGKGDAKTKPERKR